MTDTRHGPKQRTRHVDHGGLPDDDDLDAFAALRAVSPFGPPAAAEPPKPPLAAVPATSQTASPAEEPAHPAPQAPAEPAARPPTPVHPAAENEPDDDAAAAAAAAAHGDLIRQATILVSVEVAERFRHYQRREGLNGPAPSNTEVVYRALNTCDGRYSDIVARRQPQPTPGRRFGAPVPGRRVSTEARMTSQINFRPTYQDVADFRSLKRETGAQSVSAFLDAVLDEFLPPLPPADAAGRKTAARH